VLTTKTTTATKTTSIVSQSHNYLASSCIAWHELQIFLFLLLLCNHQLTAAVNSYQLIIALGYSLLGSDVNED